MSNRIPRFESHIRHMMRRLDHERMLFRIDLWDYQSVVDHADVIIDRISADHNEMPPIDHGGPWPQEWINLFVRWKDADFPRLEQPADEVEYAVERISSSVLTLSAKGTASKFGYAAWLEPAFGNESPATYSLFLEPPVTEPPFGNKNFHVMLDIKDSGATELVVNGNTVPVPSNTDSKSAGV